MGGWWRQKRGGALLRQQAADSLPWIGVEDPSEEQRLQADHANQSAGISQLPLWRPGKAYRCPRPAACVAEKLRLGGLVVRG